MTDMIPMLVEPGWQSAVLIPRGDRTNYRVLTYPDGTHRFEHLCDRGARGVVIAAPALQLGAGHTIVNADPLTILPSILCLDCGTHGFIQDGRWLPA